MNALEIAAEIRSGRISSEEITRQYLDKIQAQDPPLSAFAHLRGARALEDARRADRLRRSGETAPFLGVPIGVKDLNLLRGEVSRFGSRALRWMWSPVDDGTVKRIRRAGFVIIGKTATSELGAMPVTEPDIHPPTRNPWDPRVTSGGSSGGAGSAVAAGLIPIAQGSDGAGSIRIPSALCHLYGFKPSRGRVPNAFGFDDRTIIYTDGPIAQTVDDAAAFLDVLAGITVGKPHWAPPPPAPFFELARKPPGHLRIRFATQVDGVVTEPHIVEAIERLAQTLEVLGHRVEPGSMPVNSIDEFLPIWQHQVAGSPVILWSKTQPITRWLAEPGKRLKRAPIEQLKLRLALRVLDGFGDADLWLMPTVAISPFPVGAFAGMGPEEAFRKAAVLGYFTAPFNLSGQPAANLPIGLSPAGHPFGAQLVGKPFADATVLAVSKQIEEAMPWAGVSPAGVNR